MECDLQPKSVVNLLLKYADDNLLVPEINIDVELADEFRHVIQWADDNKIIIKQSKKKEIVFRRPSPKRLHMYKVHTLAR